MSYNNLRLWLLQWKLDLTKCQGTGNFFRYIEGSLLYIEHLHDLTNFRANRGEVND